VSYQATRLLTYIPQDLVMTILCRASRGHNMGLASAFTLLILGPFAMLWTDIKPYDCLVDGRMIHPNYTRGSKYCENFCCDPFQVEVNVSSRPSIPVGAYSLILAPALTAFENTDWG
jgi:hypothetical protein